MRLQDMLRSYEQDCYSKLLVSTHLAYLMHVYSTLLCWLRGVGAGSDREALRKLSWLIFGTRWCMTLAECKKGRRRAPSEFHIFCVGLECSPFSHVSEDDKYFSHIRLSFVRQIQPLFSPLFFLGSLSPPPESSCMWKTVKSSNCASDDVTHTKFWKCNRAWSLFVFSAVFLVISYWVMVFLFLKLILFYCSWMIVCNKVKKFRQLEVNQK